jgi:hypothetical protein
MSLMDIKSAASDLDERERASLAAWLLDSLSPPVNGEAMPDVLEEAKGRREQLNSGEVAPLSSEDFWAAVDADAAKCE